MSYEEVADACLLGPEGAVLELAVQGLREANWDVEIVEEFDLDQIGAALEDDRPLITTVLASTDAERPLAHAVVVCGLTEDQLTVMDPQVGDYVNVALADVRRGHGHRFKGGFFIGGKSA